MVDTFIGCIVGFPSWTESSEEVVKKLLHEIMVYPGWYKVTTGYHLLLKSPKGFPEQWALLFTFTGMEALVFSKSWKN